MIGKRTLWIGMVLSGSIGTILYTASYFSGAFLMLGAILLYGAIEAHNKGPGRIEEILKQLLRLIGIPLLGIFLAVAIGALIMLITGYNPIDGLKALFYGGMIKNWHISTLNAAPLIFTGLAVAVAFKAGLFNIGAEGQYYIGAMAATWLGIHLGFSGWFAIPLIFLISGAIAATFNYIPAVLKVKTGAHEVVTTMMFAYCAKYLSNIFIRLTGGDPTISKHPYITDPILNSNWLPRFRPYLSDANYRLHAGILIAVLMALLVHYLLNRTKIGFEIRAVGTNPEAARTQGISIGRTIVVVMLISGALAGFAGVNQVLGLDHRLFQNTHADYGWNGISVALLAGNNPVGVIFTAYLWGVLDAGGQYMARTEQIPNSIVEIIKGTILFLVVAKYMYNNLGSKINRVFTKKKAIT